MVRAIDLTGKVFGDLTVTGRADSDKYGRTRWNCRCICGTSLIVSSNNLRTGNTKSCGCRKRRVLAAGANRSHGMTGTPAHRSWLKMIERCENPKYKRFGDYGGRGIKVAPRWLKFENFLADMGKRPRGKTLDRIDVNGNYEPRNCRWATPKEQRANRRDTR